MRNCLGVNRRGNDIPLRVWLNFCAQPRFWWPLRNFLKDDAVLCSSWHISLNALCSEVQPRFFARCRLDSGERIASPVEVSPY